MRAGLAGAVAGVAVAAAVVGGCSSGSRKATSPCDRFGRVRDQLVETVGEVRTWAIAQPRVPVGYPDGDRLVLCLLPDGIVKGIFSDGRQRTLWQQSPDNRLSDNIPI